MVFGGGKREIPIPRKSSHVLTIISGFGVRFLSGHLTFITAELIDIPSERDRMSLDGSNDRPTHRRMAQNKGAIIN